MKYACIARHRDVPGEPSVRLMCELLDVSPAGFYASLKRPPSARERANQKLRLEIRAFHQETEQRCGAPMIHGELKARGISCGHNRVARLMREDGLRSKRPRAFRITTQSSHKQPVAENRLARRFGVIAERPLNRAWVSDITYLPTREGWLYLAVVLDLGSRRIVGWNADKRLGEDLTLAALRMAIAQRRPSKGLLHHSDRGVQYASEAYQDLLRDNDMECSMSRRGNCWDNAVAESFFATLKTELVSDARWETRESAKRALFKYIEVWYNRRRRHSTLGYVSPAQYELEKHEVAQVA